MPRFLPPRLGKSVLLDDNADRFPLGKRARLRHEHPRQHQPAAQQLPGRQRLAEHQPAGERRKHGLHAEDDGCVGGRRVPLSQHLQCVPQHHGKHAGVSDGPPDIHQLCQGMRFKPQSNRQAQ